ncbi:hypothetical protein [Jiella pelagia]|uniref:Uncharacterized protein n=1 Tax=Jiella pelagia TaxID=2986949 RepID=A0ABY7C1A0_9HYPH|nr:hypothetical protein [Jiella pelagia]WAP68809.1 hypothetical protein OH818_26845 [Jiella pelagia]
MRNIHLIASATFAALLASTALAGAQTSDPAAPAAQSADMPVATSAEPTRTGDIRSIVLFSGGVAEIIRSAEVSGDATVGMEVPLDQVNDVLKSLVVRNPGGGVGQVTLEGSVNAQELSRAALFTPADLDLAAAPPQQAEGRAGAHRGRPLGDRNRARHLAAPCRR